MLAGSKSGHVGWHDPYPVHAVEHGSKHCPTHGFALQQVEPVGSQLHQSKLGQLVRHGSGGIGQFKEQGSYAGHDGLHSAVFPEQLVRHGSKFGHASIQAQSLLQGPIPAPTPPKQPQQVESLQSPHANAFTEFAKATMSAGYCGPLHDSHSQI